MFAIGTISHGTLRQQDLLRSFSEAYQQHCASEEWFKSDLKKIANRFADFLDRHDEISEEIFDQIAAILDDLEDGLNHLASYHNCYFGSTEGDGSDYGFWPLPETEAYVETGTDDD